jgi:hypothetical protein
MKNHKVASIDYETLVRKLKKHLKKVPYADEIVIRSFVSEYLNPKRDNAFIFGDELAEEVVNILYHLHPRIKRIIDKSRSEARGHAVNLPSIVGKTITLPKVSVPFPNLTADMICNVDSGILMSNNKTSLEDIITKNSFMRNL